MRAGFPAERPRRFWTVDASVRAAGLRTADYGTGPRGGWGVVLAARSPPRLRLPPGAPRLRFLTTWRLRAAARAADAARVPRLPPSTLLHPRYAD